MANTLDIDIAGSGGTRQGGAIALNALASRADRLASPYGFVPGVYPAIWAGATAALTALCAWDGATVLAAMNGALVGLWLCLVAGELAWKRRADVLRASAVSP